MTRRDLLPHQRGHLARRIWRVVVEIELEGGPGELSSHPMTYSEAVKYLTAQQHMGRRARMVES